MADERSAPNAPNAVTVVHQPAAQRFEALVDGLLSVLDYRLLSTAAGGTLMVTTHTGVPSALGGRGIAAQLVVAALDHARTQGWRVRPDCSYVEAWMRRHPESQDLLAG